MTIDSWSEIVGQGSQRIAEWETFWPSFAEDETVDLSPELINSVLSDLAARLRDNYPFFHPNYAGQMLKPPHPIAAAAYAMAQRINPNAHALDGGPATANLEMEVVRELFAMCELPVEASLGHLTSSGTIANLEALWIARELHPGKGIAFSESAHYTHERMCQVLGVSAHRVSASPDGRIDLDELGALLNTGAVGTVVATAGTTSLGAVDPVREIIELARLFGVRVHVDAAYGGFFRLLSGDSSAGLLPGTASALQALSDADSIVIDPHKHGLQPYGCGSVLFRDASVGRFYNHDSPYTYFTSSELHLGEISLECSRAGASAAALWATLRALPLESNRGLGSILRKTRAAAVRWSELIETEETMRLVLEPELDIVSFYCLPASGSLETSEISAETQRIFAALMDAPPGEQLYLATLRLERPAMAGHGLTWDTSEMLAFRSVLMKPEHLAMVETFHDRIRAVQ